MSRPIERYRQSDVNFWGIAAIAATGLAMAMASLPAFVPAPVFTALHASRLDGGDINSLRSKLASISDEATQLRIDNAQLVTRLGLIDKARGDITKRVGALENSLPLLLEQIPPGGSIDDTIVTSSVGTITQTQDIPGGSVEISRTPLYPEQAAPAPIVTPDPSSATESAAAGPVAESAPDLDPVDTESFGMAMGATVSVKDAYLAWVDLRNKVGALLIGMEPILSGEDGGGYHIVAGPIERIAQAEEICAYIERAGLQCLPVPYDGYKLPM